MRRLAAGAVLLAGIGCGDYALEQGELPPVDDLGVLRQASVSCDQWTDTGYVDGTAFTITLVTVDNEPAEIDTANAYVVMQQAAAAAGVAVRVVSGFRTYAEQEYFYNCYVNCSCNNCNLAARPGYSNHQSGHALDLNTSSSGVLSWLNNHGADYGFERTVASEDWHWEWWGGGPGGGPCEGGAGTPCTVTETGVSGECMDTGACTALGGDHVSTPGYCPGPSNIQCCTGTTPCTVTETGESGECLDTSVCAGLGSDYVSTPGYCPGPSRIQCCTAPAPPPPPEPDAAVPEVDAGGPEADAGGPEADAEDPGNPGVVAEGESIVGGCRIAVGDAGGTASGWLLAALLVVLTARRRAARPRPW